jgi:elongation factor Ts
MSYIHSNSRVGAIVTLLCETDFVARNDEFKKLAQDIAMHVTAMDSKYLKPEDVDLKIIAKEREIWEAQLKKEGKPEKLMANILSGKEDKFRRESALLTQPFVKNPDVTVGELVAEKIGKIGENIQIAGFKRMEL